MPGPHGDPTGPDRDGRVQGVGPLRTEQPSHKGCPAGPVAQGEGRERAKDPWRSTPGAGPSAGSPVPGARLRTAGTAGYLHVRPKAEPGAGVPHAGSWAGVLVTGIPTATLTIEEY